MVFPLAEDTAKPAVDDVCVIGALRCIRADLRLHRFGSAAVTVKRFELPARRRRCIDAPRAHTKRQGVHEQQTKQDAGARPSRTECARAASAFHTNRPTPYTISAGYRSERRNVDRLRQRYDGDPIRTRCGTQEPSLLRCNQREARDTKSLR